MELIKINTYYDLIKKGDKFKSRYKTLLSRTGSFMLPHSSFIKICNLVAMIF